MHHFQRVCLVRDSVTDCCKLLGKLKALRAEKRIYEEAFSNEHPDQQGVSHKLTPLTRMILNRLLEQLDPAQEEYGGRESATIKEIDRWIQLFEEFLAIFNDSELD